MSSSAMETLANESLPKAVDSPGRYATALFNAAKKMKSLDAVIEDVKRMKDMNDTIPSLSSFLQNPTLPKSAKVDTLGAIIGKAGFNQTFSNFMMVMAENGRTTEMAKTLQSFIDIIASLKGEVICKVTTVDPLSDWELSLLKKRIKQRFFSDKPDAEITIETAIDEELLGGLTIQVGDRFMDLSTRTEIRKLSESITAA